MARRSKVTGLPTEVKAWLDANLIEGNFSGYDALASELAGRGYQISKSALHRYGSQFEQRLASLKMASEQARAIVTAAPDEEGAVSEALMRLVQEKLFQVMMDFQVDPDKPLNIASAAKAVAELSRATVNQKKWLEEVRAKASAAADQVDQVVKQAGLSAEAADMIRQQILGIAK